MANFKSLFSIVVSFAAFSSMFLSASAEVAEKIETEDTPSAFVYNSGISVLSAKDLDFNESINTSNFVKVTHPELKENKTSVYINFDSAPSTTVRVAVYGCSASGGLNGTIQYHWLNNFTLNRAGNPVSYVNCQVGIEYQIYNQVGERGYPYAGIQLQSQSRSGVAKGVWSPDSVGTTNMPVATN